MKKIFYIIIAALLCGCTKDLELEYRDLDPIPVIEANLTDEGLDIRMTLTSPMDEPMDTVQLTDYAASLTELGGQTYRLDVDYQGKHFFSECEMQAHARIADVRFQWIRMPYDHVAVMTIVMDEDPLEPDECWWIKVWRNGEIYKWMCFTDKYAIDGIVEGSTMTSRQNPEPDDKDSLADGDCLRISATRIPRHILTYLEKLSAQTIDGPTTFSGDFCLGYFLASTPMDTTVIYRPAEF